MAMYLQIAFYVGLALLVAVLVFGVVNMARTDPGQASRSNRLMRLRVIIQACVIAILVLLGIVAGSIKLF